MKTLRITFVMMSLALLSIMSYAGPAVITKGDSTIITDGKDTVTVVADLSGLKAKVNGVLNDTLLKLGNEANETEMGQDADEADMNQEDASHDRQYTISYDHQRMWGNVARDIVSYCLTAIVIIILLSLLFYYLHRRRKYKMVEKAIQNNYPLPPYIFGGSRETVRTVYMNTAPPAQSMPQVGTPATATGAQPQPGSTQAVINWNALKGGFTLAVVGFGTMVFFLIGGGYPLAGVCSILLLLGLGKMWIAYQEQKTAIAYMPPVPQQPQVPTDNPAPENNPQPETPQPPVFRGGQTQA